MTVSPLPTKPENITRVIEAIKGDIAFTLVYLDEVTDARIQFSMEDFLTVHTGFSPAGCTCNTSACIAGHVVLLQMLDKGVQLTPEKIRRAATECGALSENVAKFFGIPQHTAFYICMGENSAMLPDHLHCSREIPLSRISKNMAIKALERLRDTGEAIYDPKER